MAHRTPNPDLAFDLAPPTSDSKSLISSEYFRRTVRSSALSLLSLLDGYRSFLIPPERNVNAFWSSTNSISSLEAVQFFDIERFIASKPKTMRPFLRRFVRTQAFSTFIEERTCFSNADLGIGDAVTYFDNAIDMHRSTSASSAISKRASAEAASMGGRSSIRLNYFSGFASQSGHGKYKRGKGVLDLVASLEAYERGLRAGADTKYMMPTLKTEQRIIFDAENIICRGHKTYMYDAFPCLDPGLISEEEASCRKLLRNNKAKSLHSDRGPALGNQQDYDPSMAHNCNRASTKRWTIQALRTVDEVAACRAQADETFALAGAAPSAWSLFTLRQILGAWFSCVPQFMQLSSTPRKALLQATATMERMWNENMCVDEASYRAMIISCEIGGLSFAADAHRLFRTMQASGIVPGAVTYGCFTSAVGSSTTLMPSRPSKSTFARRRWARLRLVVALIIAFKRAGRTTRAHRLQRVASGRILSPFMGESRKRLLREDTIADMSSGSDASDGGLPEAPQLSRMRRAESAKTIQSYLSSSTPTPSSSPLRTASAKPPSADITGPFGPCMFQSVYDILGYNLCAKIFAARPRRALLSEAGAYHLLLLAAARGELVYRMSLLGSLEGSRLLV